MSDTAQTGSAPRQVKKSRLSLSNRLQLMIQIPALTIGIIVGAFSIYNAQTQSQETTEERFTAIGELRQDHFNQYLESIRSDLRAVSSLPMIDDFMARLIDGWAALGDGPTETLQRLYIQDNPNPIGQKEELDAADDGSAYSDAHAAFHPWFRGFLRDRGYYDIFLFDPDGNLIYTVFKEADYATNLVDGTYADTDLGAAFRAARDNPKVDYQAFFDFKPYAPSNGAPASFISTPIVRDGALIGVLVFQMPIDRFNSLFESGAGLGETGESLLVGSDKLVRNASRLTDADSILNRRVDHIGVDWALAGETGFLEVEFEGAPHVVRYSSIDFLGTRWAILAQETKAEVDAPVQQLIRDIIIWQIVLNGLIAVAGYFGGRQISQPVADLTGVMQVLADGDNSVEIPHSQRGDDLGDVARAVAVFKDNAIENERLTAERVKAESAAAEAKAESLRDMAAKVEAEVGQTVSTISSLTTGMSDNVGSMAEASSMVMQNAQTVAAAAEESLANAEAVAAASNQLSISINEISERVANATQIAGKASDSAERTKAIVGSLAKAADDVGAVIQLIIDVAEQTNLLALNATIEAARAGEAGKGFAVVASEVKSLANQTQQSASQITAQVGEMQAITKNAVEAINDISASIDDVNNVSNSIAAAVEEQSASTNEIAENVNQSAAGAREVSQRIADVSTDAARVDELATDVSGGVGTLNGRVASLRTTLIEVIRTSAPEVDRRSQDEPVENDRRAKS